MAHDEAMSRQTEEIDCADILSLLLSMLLDCPTKPLCLDILTRPVPQASFRSSNSSFWRPVDVSKMQRLIDAMKREAGLPTGNSAYQGSGTMSLAGQHLMFNVCPQFDGIIVTVQPVPQFSKQPPIPAQGGIEAPHVMKTIPSMSPLPRDGPVAGRGSLWTWLKFVLRRFGKS